MHPVKLLLAALLVTVSITTSATYQEVQPDERLSAILGRTFFVPLQLDSCRYPNSFSIIAKPDLFNTDRLGGSQSQKLKVLRIVAGANGPRSRYIEVELQDGTLGYIDPIHFRVGAVDNTESLATACAFELSTENLPAPIEDAVAMHLVEQQKQAAELLQSKRQREAEERKAAEIARRPGARIGMSEKDVIEKTNWGRPLRINRTTSAKGVYEQWVYGDGQYLYFQNGRLRSIQSIE